MKRNFHILRPLSVAVLSTTLLYSEAAYAAGGQGWDTTHFLVTCFNFAVFCFLLFTFARKPSAQFFKTRRESLLSAMDEAKEMREAAEARLQEYTEKMDAFEKERDELLRSYEDQGKREKQRLIDEAARRVEKMHKDAEHLIEQEVRQAISQLEEKAVSMAVDLATDIVRENLDAAKRKDLVSSYVSDLGEIGLHD